MLLLDFLDLFVRLVNLLGLFLRDDHVVNADGTAGLRGFAEAKFLELVEHDHGFFVTTNLVAAPDQVAQLCLAGSAIEEAELRWPDFAEGNTTDRGLDNLLGRIAVMSLAAVIRIGQPDAIMRLECAIRVGEE